MAERILGQEVTVRVARGGAILSTITAIKDFSFTYESTVIEEGYLGEKADRKDDIFKGCSGSFTVHPEDSSFLELVDWIKRRQQRDPATLGVKINATVTFAYADGTRPRVMFPDMKFESTAINSPGRDQFVTGALSWKCSDAKLIGV